MNKVKSNDQSKKELNFLKYSITMLQLANTLLMESIDLNESEKKQKIANNDKIESYKQQINEIKKNFNLQG